MVSLSNWTNIINYEVILVHELNCSLVKDGNEAFKSEFSVLLLVLSLPGSEDLRKKINDGAIICFPYKFEISMPTYFRGLFWIQNKKSPLRSK